MLRQLQHFVDMDGWGYCQTKFIHYGATAFPVRTLGNQLMKIEALFQGWHIYAALNTFRFLY